MKKKICIATATRAEYGCLRNLIKGVYEDPEVELQLLVTGTHLEPAFGSTVNEIIEDKVPITKKIDISISSETAVDLAKSMALAQIGFAEAYSELKPDIVVVLGDRYELIPIVTSANLARIPIAHISGGEITEGALDDMFRHAVTKLSHLHFPSTTIYAQRIIQLGEPPCNVHTVGEPGIENIKADDLLSRKELEETLKIKLGKKNLLITLHPETNAEKNYSIRQCKNLLSALSTLEDTFLIFTKSNADEGGDKINELLTIFCQAHKKRAVLFDSLGKVRYHSLLQYIDGMVGNSSSAIIESASFKIPALNIGDRQKGRTKSANIVDCDGTTPAISTGIEKILSEEFRIGLQNLENPYYQPNTSVLIKDIIKNFLTKSFSQKVFYDPTQEH